MRWSWMHLLYQKEQVYCPTASIHTLFYSFSLSKKKDHERDTELSGKLSHGQVTLRSLSGKKEHTHAPASKAEEAPAKQQ